MDRIYRFFDKSNDVSGIVIADSKEEAIYWVNQYFIKWLSETANKVNPAEIVVWKATEDDDYISDCPNVVATNY